MIAYFSTFYDSFLVQINDGIKREIKRIYAGNFCYDFNFFGNFITIANKLQKIENFSTETLFIRNGTINTFERRKKRFSRHFACGEIKMNETN